MIFRRFSNFRTVRRWFSSEKYFLDDKYQNFNVIATNHVGSLHNLCKVFERNGVNLTYVRTHHGNITPNGRETYTLQISLARTQQQTIDAVRLQLEDYGATLVDTPKFIIPWFPRTTNDLNLIGLKLLDVDEKVGKDSLQFTDPQYRKRRNFIANVAKQYKMGEQIPDVPYTDQETQLWCNIFNRLRPLHDKSMSRRYNRQMKKLDNTFQLYKRIPQLNELNEYLRKETGFKIKPTHGILSQRQFLNSFAFKTFCCTQYIRHHETPDYVPEPDIVHEIVGHIPMFADPDVAELSHKIGLLSLGASDDQVAHLGALYWFTLQFGVCLEGNQKLGYGAGIASSIAEIENLMSGKPSFKSLEPLVDSSSKYPIQSVQECYRVTESFSKSLADLEEYGKYIMKSVTTYYNYLANTVQYDRHIEGVFNEDKGPKF